jgi:hypothetical protein
MLWDRKGVIFMKKSPSNKKGLENGDVQVELLIRTLYLLLP